MKRITPGPGQQSVWDYPRPPRLEPCEKLIEVQFGGQLIASTRQSWRVLETYHPPVYYLPPTAFIENCLQPAEGQSFCEWKGVAQYWNLCVGENVAQRAAWSYPEPTNTFSNLANFVALYAQAVDQCRVDGQIVKPQPGRFYGGWITPDVVGPFKGEPGTYGW